MRYSFPCNCGGSLCYDINTAGLYTASLEDLTPHRLITGALDPAWNPASNQIAFLTISNTSSDIVLTDLAISRSDGTAFQSITRKGSVDSFSWSPNGNFLAYRILGRIPISQKNVSTDTTANNFVEYWIYSVNETKNTYLGRYYYQLSPTSEKLSPIYWSSSGDRIIIFNETLDRWEIPVNKTPAENIISDSHKSWLTIDYNPGKNLAVFSTYSRQIFLFNLSTNETISLAPEGSCTGVAWKPDGNLISCSNETQIRLINPEMSQPFIKTMSITTPGQPLMKEMIWGPEGTRLIFEQQISSSQCNPQSVSKDIFWDPPHHASSY